MRHSPNLLIFNAVLLACLFTTGCSNQTDADSNSAIQNSLLGNASDLNTNSASMSTSPVPEIAVIDVNEIAREIGILDEIQLMVESKEIDSAQRFAEIQTQYAEEYRQFVAKIGEPNEQSQQALYGLQQRHMQSLNSQWQTMQNEITEFHNEIKTEFLEGVRAVAIEVAKSKGMTTVLTTKQVFSVDDQCDITTDVADSMRLILANSGNQPTKSDSQLSEKMIGEFKDR